MKRFQIVFIQILCIAILLPALSAEEIIPKKATGRVDSVVIYSDRALVRRTHSIKLTGTFENIRFTGFPLKIVPSSIRVSGKGVSISGIQIRKKVNLDDDEEEKNPLKIKIDDISRQIRSENDLIQNLQNQLNLLNTFGKLTASQADKDFTQNSINVESWQKAMQFIESRRTLYQDKIYASEKKLKDLSKELKQATDKYNEENYGRQKYPVEVDVSVTGADKAQGNIYIEYLVNDVSWSGVYELRGNSESGTFQLLTQANIRQNSGENWKSAELTLSTARPAAGVSPGILQPWRIRAGNIGQLSNDKNLRRERIAEEKEDSMEADMELDSYISSDISNAAESAEITVKIPGRESVMSDNAEHRVVLSSSKLTGQISYTAVPSRASFVFIKARLKNTSPMPVGPGEMNLFLDGNYVGNIYFSNHAAVGEDFDVFFGPDQRFQVKRKLLRGDIVGAGVFDKKVEILNQWQIEVSNFSGKPKEIIIYDQFPVPADPNITTKFIGTSKKEFEKDLNGILKWTVNAAPSSSEKFDFTYSITLPETSWNSFLENKQMKRKVRQSKGYYQQMDESPAASPDRNQDQKQMYNVEEMFMK